MEINSGKNKKLVAEGYSKAVWNIRARVFDSTFELSHPADVERKVWELKMVLN
jgi:hypothetical protein